MTAGQRRSRARKVLGLVLSLTLIAGGYLALGSVRPFNRMHVVGYFANSTGLFVGDEVRILGLPVGEIADIEPQGTRVKIDFWYDGRYSVPADAKAVILSPSLVSARAIQLTPPYTGGAQMADNAVIDQDRTAVPIEWDDLRSQLAKLTDALEPTEEGGMSTMGALVNTAADNMRGEGGNIRNTLIQLSQAVSALGDHSQDIFGSVENLSVVVSALQDSTAVMGQLNQNLAVAGSALANDPEEIAAAVRDTNAVLGDVDRFVGDSREMIGATSATLASLTTAVVESLDDVEQLLHIAPTTFQNFANTYHPSHGSLRGALVLNHFNNPISFICGAIQAASRLGAEQSSKLCVQYLAPIVKNRQYNFLPLGINPFAATMARPNEITYTEDWLRPDYVPPAPAPAPAPAPLAGPGAAEVTAVPQNLEQMLVPMGSGS